MRTALTLFVSAAVPFPLLGQSVIQPGQVFPGGTQVMAPATGVSFQVPAGSQGGYDPESEAFLIRSSSQPNGALAVVAYSEGTVHEVGEVVIEKLTEAGIQLQPRGEPQYDGTTLRATFTAYMQGGQGLVIGAVRSGPPGNTIAVLGFGPAAEEAALSESVDQVLASTRFQAPQAAQWRGMLAGTRLVYLGQHSNYSPGGVGDGSYASQREERYDFCGNGGYAYYMRSESYLSVEGVGGASSETTDGHQGSWRLIADIVGAAHLVLEDTQGQVRTYLMEERENGVVVGEGLFRVERSPSC